MRCPNCQAPIIRSEEENIKNFRCSNRANCPAIKEAHYSLNLSIREGWWFAEKYHLPFKSEDKWYCVIGPEYVWKNNSFAPRTILQEIIIHHPKRSSSTGITFHPATSYATCSQKTLLSIPYMALPANQDFSEQFNILVDRVMKLMVLI